MSAPSAVAPRSIGALARAAPGSRDRYVDLLRAGSILLVVTGHWLIAAVVRVDGGLEGANALSTVPWMRPLTWLFQVMPVFFMVGGFANALALRRPGATAGAFLRRRAGRLLLPTVVFAGAWLVGATVVAGAADSHTLRVASSVAAQPLWFLAVYVLLALLAPLQWRAHRRNRWVALAALPALAAGLDVVRLTGAAPRLADVNYVVVFAFAQGLGFWYADGVLVRMPRRYLALAAVGGAGVLAALTSWGPYPVSMVGVPGQALSNMSPPTVCVLVLTVVQVAVLMAVRPALVRWVQRPRVWRGTVAVNTVVLTVFLWHLSAFVGAGLILTGAGQSLPAVGTAAWWRAKPAWFGLAILVLAVVVLAAGRVERPGRGSAGGAESVRCWAPAAGLVLATVGLIGLASTGFADALGAGGRHWLGVQFSPLAGFCLLVAGWAVARAAVRRP